MARPLRIEYPGAIYHITSRGNAKEKISIDDNDKELFVLLIEHVADRYQWLCYAYCLMPAHYHLLIETPEGNLSSGMKQLNGIYTQKFNKRHERVGHVFQGRFKAILVQKERYLLELCRYIVLNPVRAGLVNSPEEWRWSSYPEVTGIRKRRKFLRSEWILTQFGNNRGVAREAYKEFVFAGIKKGSPWRKLKSRVFLGEDGFILQIKELVKKRERVKEIPRVERFAGRPSLNEIFRDIKTKSARNEKIYRAHVRHGYTLTEIGKFLGLHYSTTSKIRRKIEGERRK